MRFQFTSLLFLGLAVALATAVGNPGYKHVEELVQSIDVPDQPTNPVYQQSYMCVVWSAQRFKQYTNAHITRIKDLNNETLAHHGWMTIFPASSPYFLPGQILENPEDGKVYPDCIGVAGGFNTLFPQQAMLSDLNTFATDKDASTANGYRLGMYVGPDIAGEWVVAQVHVHNPDHTPGLTTDIHYEVHLTSQTPERRAGWISGGLFPWASIPVNSDDTHVISIAAPPATTDISLVEDPSDFDQCVHYCPEQKEPNPVHFDNRFEGRFENSGISKVLIEGGYIHAHEEQYRLTFEVLRADGTAELIYECDECGHHGENPDAWKWMDVPVELAVGDGIRTNCTYKKHRHHNQTGDIEDIVFGFGSEQQMCIPFFLVSYEGEANSEPFWLPMGGFCDAVQNPGYANEVSAVPPIYAGACSIPTCASDCICNPYFCGFF